MSGPREVSDELKKAIEEKLVAYAQAVRDKDIPGIVNLFCDNGVWLPPLLPPIIGKAHLTEAFKNVFANADVGSSMEFETLGTYIDENAGDCPSILYTYGKLDAYLPIKDGETAHLPQKYLIVFTLIDNDWKLATVCFNFTGEIPSPMNRILRESGSA